MDPGHRARDQAARPPRERPAQRRLRAALGRRRLDVRRRGRPGPGRDDGARQPAQPEAGDRARPGLPAGRRAGRRRDERLGARLLRPPDHRRLAPRSSTSPRGSSGRAACTSTTATSASASGTGFSASIVDLVLFVVNNRRRLRAEGRSIVLYLPKIQTAEEAALWNEHAGRARAPPGAAGRDHQGLRAGRADRGLLPADGDPRRAGPHFVGFNTGRWDYINSVSDALAWDAAFVNPNIDAIGMTYGYMRELRGPRAPGGQHARPRTAAARSGRAGWSRTSRSAREAGVAAGMKRAVAGGEREQREGASGKWVAHWKMVHIVRPGLGARRRGQPARARLPAADLHAGGRRGPGPARARAAHGARGARPAQRRAAVRQRVRAGVPGRRAQARRLLRKGYSPSKDCNP